MASPAAPPSTGIADLDRLLSNLLPGDNVVWVGDDEQLLARLEDAFLRDAARHGRHRTYVATKSTPAGLRDRLGEGVEILDARPRGEHGSPMALEQALLHPVRSAPLAAIVVDGLDRLVRRWSTERALGVFTRVCPRLFETGTIAYWRIRRGDVPPAFVEGVRKVTQCVLDVRQGHVHVVKAEGRRRCLQGQLFELSVDDGEIRIRSERSLGRLARGLERVRRERNLSQAELARLAGVTQGAISQAEAGRRGLSLDTLLLLTDSLGVGIDDLLSAPAPTGYVFARRERMGADATFAPLLDDPGAGLRAYLVRLGPMESGSPPFAHKGAELVVVGSGLVQLTVGNETPVMRPGDAALATDVGVSAWRNLVGEPARFFWILRD